MYRWSAIPPGEALPVSTPSLSYWPHSGLSGVALSVNFSAKLPGKSVRVHTLKPLVFFPWKHSRGIANQAFRILIQMYFWGKVAAAVGSSLGCSGDPRLRAVPLLTRLAHPLLLSLGGSSVKTLAGASGLAGQEKDRASSQKHFLFSISQSSTKG